METIEELQAKLVAIQDAENPNVSEIITLAVSIGEKLFLKGRLKESFEVSKVVAENIEKLNDDKTKL